jgi:hypothetical protein
MHRTDKKTQPFTERRTAYPRIHNQRPGHPLLSLHGNFGARRSNSEPERPTSLSPWYRERLFSVEFGRGDARFDDRIHIRSGLHDSRFRLQRNSGQRGIDQTSTGTDINNRLVRGKYAERDSVCVLGIHPAPSARAAFPGERTEWRIMGDREECDSHPRRLRA